MRYLTLILVVIGLCDDAFSQVGFNPVNLGRNINSEFDEYFPTFTADDSLMIFTRRVKFDSIPENEDFFISIKAIDGNYWGEAKDLGSPINTPCNEGTPSISADGSILVFTSCANGSRGNSCRETIGRCDIFFAINNNGVWNEAINVGSPVNSKSYESQPSLAADSRTLYFVRAEVNEKGETNQDIFYAVLNDAGSWSTPIRLNSNINTKGRESSPFIHPDGKTLYFASDGHGGFGGMDIFVSRKDETGEWGRPVNLGSPINTTADESALVVSASGKWGYFSSNRPEGYGGIDIYRFEMPEELRPKETIFMKDKTIVLNNIFFDTDDFSLKSESFKSLDEVVKLMSESSSLVMEISGHTDSSGNATRNVELSKKRAESVYKYLLNSGISSARISYTGYGSTYPIESNDTDSGRAKNRRIEMKLNGVVNMSSKLL